MKAVNKDFVKTVFNLLLVNSDPNLQFEETGETALHMAVANINILLVKALLAFDADPDIKNNNGETPLDIAISIKADLGLTPDIKLALGTLFKFGPVEPKEHDHDHHHRHHRRDHKHNHHVKHARVDINVLNKKEYADKLDTIIDILIESNKLRAKTEKYFSKHSDVPEPQKSNDTYVLSMDGGGMRVLVLTQILVNIEERMSDLASSSVRMYKYFDYIVGTSAGGQTACALAYLKADAYNVRAIMSRARYVIASAASERKGRIEETFQQTFSKFLKMGDIEPSRRVIVTASLAHVIPFELHLMTSYGEPRDGHAGPKERKVWEACHISGAAPYYSPLLFDLKLLDGGLVANNPTLDGMAEIIEQGKKEGKPVKFGMVLSLGTGFSPKEQTKEVELFGTSILSLLSPKNIHAMESLASHFASQSLLTD
ncbi:PREDICTED: 85/88 kDa calcium-independent phospholipase A2-like, partial [Amphimedon queenslandica]|uniref:phospholipase A2 n=2 Tax=Amphimedon queenslandica TaxID=400682 RepID=A0AAN0IT93_AMPQE